MASKKLYPTFSGTKKAAHRLKIIFGLAGFKAAELHGDLTQAQRLDVSTSNITISFVFVNAFPSIF